MLVCCLGWAESAGFDSPKNTVLSDLFESIRARAALAAAEARRAEIIATLEAAKP